MLAPQAIYRWRDGNQKDSINKIWLPAGETIAQSIARVNAVRSALVGISSAQLTGGEILFEEFLPGDPPDQLAGDVRQNLVLFFRDERGAASWRIPSPRSDLPYDQADEWRGIRIQPEALQNAGFLAAINTALPYLRFPWGDEYPQIFTVAGIDFVIP